MFILNTFTTGLCSKISFTQTMFVHSVKFPPTSNHSWPKDSKADGRFLEEKENLECQVINVWTQNMDYSLDCRLCATGFIC